jgi:putative peptidoglycan lipid II flippase
LARAAAQSDRIDFQRQFTNGARLTVGLTLLPCLAMALFATPIVRIVLGWGEFSTSAVDTTARALTGLAIGLVGFSLYLFALRGFYSHSDTRTPFFINVGQNALNIALALVLATRYDVLGLGLAFAMSYLVFAVVTVQMLHHRHGTPSLLTLLNLRPLLNRQSHNQN